LCASWSVARGAVSRTQTFEEEEEERKRKRKKQKQTNKEKVATLFYCCVDVIGSSLIENLGPFF
jgi:hypothetical protein